MEHIVEIICPFLFHVLLGGTAWVQCTGALDPLRCCRVSSFVEFLYMWQHLNRSSAPVHSIQAVPFIGRVDRSTIEMLMLMLGWLFQVGQYYWHLWNFLYISLLHLMKWAFFFWCVKRTNRATDWPSMWLWWIFVWIKDQKVQFRPQFILEKEKENNNEWTTHS